MKSVFFTIAFAIALISLITPVSGQDQWIPQSARPQPRNLSGIEWVSPTHAFIAGENMTLMETLDGGATWRRIELGAGDSSYPLYDVYFIDANNGITFGNSGTSGPDVYRTTNGGQNWQRVTGFPLGGSWYRIDFVSPTTGFMGANGAIARTVDDGATWDLMADYTTSPVVYGMDFRDASVGVVGGNFVSTSGGGPGIFKTVDGGVTWVRKHPQSANDVLWLDNTTLLAASAAILRSTDAGETWSAISNDVTTGLDDMTLLPNGTIVGVSGTGDAWRSTNGGVSWTRTLRGIGALPSDWAVEFFDSQTGAVVGQGGLIYKTTDGGVTWKQMNSGIGGVEFRDLEMFNDNIGLAVGDDGYFVRTTNGGNFWDVNRLQVTGVVLFRNESLQAVSIVDSDFAVVAGYDGVVYKTFDKGANWQSIGYPNLPGEYFISDVKFVSRDVGYVTGNRPNHAEGTYKTIDGGASWQLVPLNIGHTIDFVDPDHGWIVNVGGLGYRTENGGATWQQIILPNQGFSPTISKIDFVNRNEGWAVGWYGYAAHTIDGGLTWQLQNIGEQDEQILGLYAVSRTEVLAVGVVSIEGTVNLYHTTDTGATWRKFAMPVQYSLSAVFASPSGKVWTSGYDGVILHHPNFASSSRAARFDFDGDGKADVSIFRPSAGEWWYLKSSNGGNAAFRFGSSSDKIAPADFTGDGKTDGAFFRPSTGEWFVLRSEDSSFYSFPFGTSGDTPAPADYDGDGKADPAVFRPSNSTWYINRSSGGTTIMAFGQSGDIPVPADYDADGKADIAIYRPSLGEWWLQRSTGGSIAFRFGNVSDKPVPGDYTGDGKTDAAVYRPSTGEWFVLRSEDFSYYSFPFGSPWDIPAPADYDGDGKFDAAVFRPSNSTWFVQRTTDGTLIRSFGQSGDVPAPGAFIP